MYFEKLIGHTEMPESIENTIHRTAVRAAIIRNGKILLIRSAQGIYELPGGGVEEGESFKDALAREVMEETGYTNCRIKSKIGVVTEERLDRFEKHTAFCMVSHYYLCELRDEEKCSQQYENHEWEPGTTALWIELGKAKRENQAALEQNSDLAYIQRENFVLDEIERNFEWVRTQQDESKSIKFTRFAGQE